jgi:hypothetical protein
MNQCNKKLLVFGIWCTSVACACIKSLITHCDTGGIPGYGYGPSRIAMRTGTLRLSIIIEYTETF